VSYAFINLINLVFQVLTILILIEVVGSWILASRIHLPEWGYTILRAVHAITSPILGPIRRLIPAPVGLDLSPIIALILVQILQRLLIGALLRSF
jgi:YggT family protein